MRLLRVLGTLSSKVWANPYDGALLSKTVSDGFHPCGPRALSKVACAGPARSTPPLRRRVFLGRGSAAQRRQPDRVKARAAHQCTSSRPSVYSLHYCLRGDYDKESDGNQRTGLKHRTSQSVSSSMLCLSESTVRLCPIGHLQPRCFTFGFRRRARGNWRCL